MKNYKLLAIFLLGLFIFSCSDDDDTTDTKKAGTLDQSIYNNAELLAMINQARTNPQLFAEKLRERLDNYSTESDGTLIYTHKNGVRFQVSEGKPACQEAISFLESRDPIGAMTINDNMSKAAQDHADDQSINNTTGHDGTDGSDPTARLDRYGDWQITNGENIMYGSIDSEHTIIDLIIDDNVKSRGHRTNFFDPNFKLVGIGMATHTEFRNVIVFDFAGGYKDK